MGGTIEITGPDLSEGVSASDVAPGSKLLGHAHGKPVLLVRTEKDWFAVGAVCTHYSGPLGEGIVAGESVRCPWHHACFDLKTGTPSAPALDPIPCYRIVRRGDRVAVGKQLEPPPPTEVSAPARIVIAGAGPAGAMAAEALRRFGHTGSIVLVGAEATPPVDRTNLSKDYLAGNAPEEWMLLRDDAYYQKQKIDFRKGQTVVRIDRGKQCVELEGGEELGFDALILATGAEPVRLPIPGGEQIQTLRTLADSRAIIERAKKGSRAVVIGSSFIGLEVAASLRERGVEVSVIGKETAPLSHVLGQELSDLVRGLHEAHGVAFHLGRTVRSATPRSITLDDGTELEADFVVAGVGVKPRTELAEQAGLEIDRGIVVDGELRAAPGVYAIGDVARFPDRRSGDAVRIEHWVVAQRHGEMVARTLLGKPAPSPATPFFWSAHYDVTINYVGHAERWDRSEVEGDLAQRDAAVHYYRNDKLLAVATVGRDQYALEVARRFADE